MKETDFKERNERTLYAPPACEFHTVGDIVSTSYALPVMPLPREQDHQIEVDGD